jgi:hypothetical protein
MASMPCSKVAVRAGSAEPRVVAHSAVTQLSVETASTRWWNCTAAVCSNVLSHQPVDSGPQYLRGKQTSRDCQCQVEGE